MSTRSTDYREAVDHLPEGATLVVQDSSESSSKFPIYSAFGIPEIWRYDLKHNRAQICELRGSAYVEVPSSRSFPILTAAALTDFANQSKTLSQKAVLAAFRRWIKTATD